MVQYFIGVLVFIFFDFVTGTFKAVKQGNWDSSVMREGLINKATEIVAYALMVSCQFYLPVVGVDISGVPIVQITSLYLAIMEIGSSLENIGAVNPEVANVLKPIFSKLKEVNKHE